MTVHIIHYQSCFVFHCLKEFRIEKAGSRKNKLFSYSLCFIHSEELFIDAIFVSATVVVCAVVLPVLETADQI